MLKQHLTKLIAVVTIAAASVAITAGCGDENVDESDPPPPMEDENQPEQNDDPGKEPGDDGT